MLALQNTLKDNDDEVTWWEILLMIYFLGISGNPFLSKSSLRLTYLIIPAIYFLKKMNNTVSYRTILIFIFFLGYELMHAFIYRLDYTLTIIKIFLVLLISAVIIDIFKHRFIHVLTKTMVILSVISFVFVILCYIPGVSTSLYNLAVKLFPANVNYSGYYDATLLVFTFNPAYFNGEIDYVRNSGMFWEPTAFAVYLNLTLFLHYCSKRILVIKDLFDRDSVILMIALITTTSTTGLIAFILMLAFFSLQLKTAAKYFLFATVIIASFLSFSSLDFLGNKISKQLTESGNKSNRFGSFIMDMEHIMKHPLIGNSRRIEVAFGTSKFSAKTHRPNGVSTLLRNYGLIYFTMYYVLVFLSFRKIYHYYHGKYSFAFPAFGVLLLLILSFSENIWDDVSSKSLMFLYLAYFMSPDMNALKTFKPFFYEKKLSVPAGKLYDSLGK